MPTYIVAPCSVADGAALSRNNISAFWRDPNWVLSWRHKTLEQHVAEVAKRYPRNLLRDRAAQRHQKAVDPATGRLAGYARWVLPPSHAGFATWPEAVVPAVTEAEEAEIERVAATAVWDPNPESDVLVEPISKIKKEILGRKPYLRLDYMAVHPENQGKGIATTLVESGMEQADMLGLDIFVLAFQAGRGVYKRLGFRIEQELVQDDSMYGGTGEYAVYFMIYEHKSSGP
ncbi:uncharacterized protein JN550_004496 [Neoarthrinium moseri]|uniref:uncharacterized protein n=1 Tax=Neoarthrinium moseri TaxID=1658444 RepID=UPI001FDD8783|nr:uncharacterized protein JN550_004496 [Neoarthrinium moseri]KAI1871502.1 hypothetical protein JN550_004496 [Neoarthrinium moseri]